MGLEENIAIVVRELELLTDMCTVKAFDPVDIQNVMADTYEHVRKHHIYDIWYVDSAGIFRGSLNSPQFFQQDFSEQSYFQKAAGLHDRQPIFEYFNLPGNERDEKGMAVAMPIFSDDDSFGG